MANEIKKTGFIFTCALLSAFAVANGLIRAPLNKGGLLPFFAAALAGALIAAAFFSLLNRFFKIKNGTVFKIVCLVLAAAVFISAVLTAKEYCNFVYSVVLYRSGMPGVGIIFALCVLCLALSGERAVYKFSFLAVFAVTVIFAVLFILSEKTFDIKNLKGAFALSGLSFQNIWLYLKTMFLPTLGALLFISLSPIKLHPAGVAAGMGFGALLCLIVIFDVVLNFGMPLAAKLDYPYIEDISTVTVGNLFTRMDGFAYIAFFLCHLIKSAVGIKCSVLLIKRAGLR